MYAAHLIINRMKCSYLVEEEKNLDTIQNKVLLKTAYKNKTSKFRENETVAIWKNVCQIS